MSNHLKHKQIPVKVNALVDEGIAGVVTALSQDGQIVTFSSCEGRNGKLRDDAHVYFHYGQPDSDFGQLATCARNLARVLAVDDCYDTEVAIEWCGDKETPFISLRIPAEQTTLVATILADRISELTCDT